MVSPARTPLTPDEITRRQFSSAFRGFDPTEVADFLNRVADELRLAYSREQSLRGEVEEARRQAAMPPHIDEAVVTTYLGEEAAEILRTVTQAAQGIKVKAEESAERLMDDALQEASRLREEAQADAIELRRSADEAVSTMRDQARVESDEVLEEARNSGRHMVQEAQAHRTRVLGDLAKRRKVVQVQLEQLVAGRDRLLETYRRVRQSLDEVTGELQNAESSARQEADEAVRKSGRVPEFTIEDLESELAEAKLTSQAIEEALDQPKSREGKKSTEEPLTSTVMGQGDAPESETSKQAGVRSGKTAIEEPVISLDEPDRDVSRSAKGPRRPRVTEEKIDALRTRAREPESVDVAEAVTIIHEEKPAEPGIIETPKVPSKKSEPVAASPEIKPEPAAKTEPAANPEPVVSAPEEPEPEARHKAKGSIEALFARMKADRPPAGDKNDKEKKAAAPLPEAAKSPKADVDISDDALKGSSAEPSDAASSDEPGEAPSSNEPAEPAPLQTKSEPVKEKTTTSSASPIEQRDEIIQPLHALLTRKLKRIMQDEQNDVLDNLRSQKGKMSTEALPKPDQQREHYKSAAIEHIETCFASALGNQARSDVNVNAEAALIADELADSIVTPLSERLEISVSKALDEPAERVEQVAMSSIGAVYKDWKRQRLNEVASDFLVSTAARATLASCRDGATLTWVVDKKVRCRECQSNASAGAIIKGKPFPTGQTHPPAHSGCRCVIVTE